MRPKNKQKLCGQDAGRAPQAAEVAGNGWQEEVEPFFQLAPLFVRPKKQTHERSISLAKLEDEDGLNPFMGEVVSCFWLKVLAITRSKINTENIE